MQWHPSGLCRMSQVSPACLPLTHTYFIMFICHAVFCSDYTELCVIWTRHLYIIACALPSCVEIVALHHLRQPVKCAACQFFHLDGFWAAAPHSKSGVTKDAKLADKNQQNTLPHSRLMEWVWGYFVDSSPDPGTSKKSGHHSSTKAGAVHAQPSKQASGSSHWKNQEAKPSKQQRISGQQTASGLSGAAYDDSTSPSVSRTGTALSIFVCCFALQSKACVVR